MPIALDPQETVVLYLPDEAGQPGAVGIRCRYVTRRERTRIGELCKQAVAATAQGLDTAWDLQRQALAIGVIGPVGAKGRDGQALPETLEAMEEVFTEYELWQLVTRYPDLLWTAEVERKKLRSPSPPASGEGNSAKPAEAASA